MVLFIPVSMLYTIIALIGNFGQHSQRRQVTDESPVVMVTGGKMAKSLHFARWFWKAGYKVVMVETDKYWLVGARFSRAVTAFETVPCPRSDPKGYVDGLVRVAQKHNASFFVPVASPAAAISDAAAKSQLEHAGCRVLHFDLGACTKLDNKHTFCQLIRDLDLTAPKSLNVPSEDMARQLNKELQEHLDGKKYVLKNLVRPIYMLSPVPVS